MQKLACWLEQQASDLVCARGLADQVEFDGPETCRSCVYINSSASKPSQLAALIHECGHVIINRRRRRSQQRRIFGFRHSEWWKARRPSQHWKLAELQEELAAWDVGMELAQRLRVRVSLRRLRCCRSRALMTYVRALSGVKVRAHNVRWKRTARAASSTRSSSLR